MNPITLLDKKVLTSFGGEFVDTLLSGLDKLKLLDSEGLLASLPFGRIISFIGEKAVTIADRDKSFSELFKLSWLLCFYEALERFYVEGEGDEEILVQLKQKGKSLGEIFPAGQYDPENFLDMKIQEVYRRSFEDYFAAFKVKEFSQKKIFAYIRNHQKIRFLEAAEKLKTKFSTFNAFIDSKAFPEIKKQQKREKYFAKLKDEFREPVLMDQKGLSLEDIYIKPDFRIHRFSINTESNKEYFRHKNNYESFFELKEVFSKDLHDFVYGLLEGEAPEYLKTKSPGLIFLLGYPGQGKTSFCKKMIFDALEGGDIFFDRSVYLLRFKEFENTRNLLENPMKAIKTELENKMGHLPEDFEQSILLLDGLDELSMKNNIDTRKIDLFCQDLAETLARENYRETRIIVTSRCGYIHTEGLRNDDALILQLKEFDPARQQKWLGVYRKFHPGTRLTAKDLAVYNKEKKYEHLKELTGQPILLHMIASSNIEITEDLARSELYNNLFNTVIKVKWKHGQQLSQLKNLTPENLRLFLEEIALKIYQSDSEYIHRDALMELPGTKDFLQAVGREGIQTSLKGVMIAFYFREVETGETDENFAIEFLHKSLYEYLAAERIWYEMEEFTEKTRRGFVLNDGEAALKKAFELFSPKLLSREIVGYLIEIIGKVDIEKRMLLSKRLESFFPELLERDFLLLTGACEIRPIDQALNAFFGYWTFLVHLIDKKNYLNKDNREDFIRLIKYLGQKKENLIIFIMHQDLRGLNLNGANLSGANLSSSKLSSSKLRGVNLRRSTMCDVDLRDADFKRANLSGANLSGANLSGAHLIGANLSEANLIGANLSGAILSGAILSGAILSGAILSGAILGGANLSGANLSGAILSGAILSGAILSGAILSGAILSGANLSGAILRRANLRRANLREADLSGVDLRDANLRKADLRDANLRGAILTNTIMPDGIRHD